MRRSTMFTTRRSQLAVLFVIAIIAALLAHPATAFVPNAYWAGHPGGEQQIAESFCWQGELTEKSATLHFDFGDKKGEIFAQAVTYFEDGTHLDRQVADGEFDGKGYLDFIADWRSEKTTSMKFNAEITFSEAKEPVIYEVTIACFKATAYLPLVNAPQFNQHQSSKELP